MEHMIDTCARTNDKRVEVTIEEVELIGLTKIGVTNIVELKGGMTSVPKHKYQVHGKQQTQTRESGSTWSGKRQIRGE